MDEPLTREWCETWMEKTFGDGVCDFFVKEDGVSKVEVDFVEQAISVYVVEHFSYVIVSRCKTREQLLNLCRGLGIEVPG